MLEELTYEIKFYKQLLAFHAVRNVTLTGERFEYGFLSDLKWFVENHLVQKQTFGHLLEAYRILIEVKMEEIRLKKEEIKETQDLNKKRDILLDIINIEKDINLLMDIYDNG